jgi:methionyl aminopeptidase
MNIINFLFPPKTPSPRKIRQSRRGVEIKSPAEIEIMRLRCKIVGTVLQEIADMVKPGMTTADLDSYAQKRL